MLFAICLCYLLCYGKSSSNYPLCHLLLLSAFAICFLLSAYGKSKCDLLFTCRLFQLSTICYAFCFAFLLTVRPMSRCLTPTGFQSKNHRTHENILLNYC